MHQDQTILGAADMACCQNQARAWARRDPKTPEVGGRHRRYWEGKAPAERQQVVLEVCVDSAPVSGPCSQRVSI